ncbi:MAG: hypothetical protein AABO41_18640 [Acidobacteriota bacterium]
MVESAQKDFTKRVKSIALSPVSGVALFVLISCLALNTKFDFVDDAYYIVLAKSLAGGFGFSDIHLPEPHFHRHFPPGLPLILSLPMLLGLDPSTSVVIYKLVLIACGAVGLYCFAHFALAEGYSRQLVSSAMLLASVSIIFVGFTTRVGSEMLYVLFSALALLALNKYEQSSLKSRWLALSALFLVASVLTRSIGLVMLGAAVLSWILKRDFRRAALLVIASVVLWSPWFMLSKTGGSGVGSYYHEFLTSFHPGAFFELGKRAVEDGWLLLNRDIPRAILSIGSSEFVESRPWLDALVLPLRLGISTIVILSILRGIRQTPRIASLYVAGSLFLVMIWPWDPSRYIVPLIPLLCLSFVAGLQTVFERLPAKHPKSLSFQPKLIAGVVATCIASQLISDARFVLTIRRTGHYNAAAASIWNEITAAYEWINQNTAQSSIVGCEPAIDPSVYLFTGRKSLALPSRPEAYKRLGVTHILHVTSPTMYKGDEVKRRPDLQEFLDRTGGKVPLTLVYRSANVSVFQVN